MGLRLARPKCTSRPDWKGIEFLVNGSFCVPGGVSVGLEAQAGGHGVRMSKGRAIEGQEARKASGEWRTGSWLPNALLYGDLQPSVVVNRT